MDITTAVLTILGLAVFESITSIDNAIINAEVLATVLAQLVMTSEAVSAWMMIQMPPCRTRKLSAILHREHIP